MNTLRNSTILFGVSPLPQYTLNKDVMFPIAARDRAICTKMLSKTGHAKKKEDFLQRYKNYPNMITPSKKSS